MEDIGIVETKKWTCDICHSVYCHRQSLFNHKVQKHQYCSKKNKKVETITFDDISTVALDIVKTTSKSTIGKAMAEDRLNLEENEIDTTINLINSNQLQHVTNKIEAEIMFGNLSINMKSAVNSIASSSDINEVDAVIKLLQWRRQDILQFGYNCVLEYGNEKKATNYTNNSI